jgi:hypothetical protein
MTAPDPTIPPAEPTAPPSGPPPGPPSGPPPGAPSAAPPSGYPQAGPPPMAGTSSTPPGLVLGVILVVVGSVFLALRVADVSIGPGAWALWIIVPGLALLLGSLAIPPRGGLGLAIPGAILATVGAILWVQEAYGLYSTWAYAWALVAPTAPGFAMLLYGGVRGDHELAADGLRTMLIGLGLFLGFGLFFEGVVGISGHRIQNLDQVLPYAAIGLGALLVVLSLFGSGSGRRQRRRERRQERRERRRGA